MADERGSHGEMRPDVVVKNDWVLKAHDQSSVDVVNVSSHDLKYYSRLLTKAEYNKQASSQPVLKRLVSANILSDAPDRIAPQPFFIREMPSRNTQSKPVRVAFIGLTETVPAAPRGFKFIDTVEAARRAAAEARKQADVVIALAHVKTEEAARIAREAPGIDVIIAGNSQPNDAFFTPPMNVSDTFIVFTPYESRMLGELRFYREEQGKFSARVRFVTLDEKFADDPAAAQTVVAAREAGDKSIADTKAMLDDWLSKTRAADAANSGGNSTGESSPAYVSSIACAQCHMAQYIQWTNSAHAHASKPIALRRFEFEISCLNCHATGQQHANGQGGLAQLQNVQCEQCHGPGGDHARKPAKGYGRIANPQALCASCHTADTDADFNLQTAWAKIKH